MGKIESQLTPEDFGKSFDMALFSEWKTSVEEHKKATTINIVMYLVGLLLMIVLGGFGGIALFFVLAIIGIAIAMPKAKKRKNCQRELGISHIELRDAIVKCRNRIQGTEELEVNAAVNKPVDTSKTSSSANHGTRIETQSQSMAYWIGERMANPKKAPFVYYIFNSSREARAALLALPFIHEEHPTGKLTCDHIFHFGYYDTTENNIPTGKWDAFIAGYDLTHEMWEQIHFAFKKHNGTMKSDLEPDKNVQTASIQRGNSSKVVFVREDRNDLGTYLTYKGPSKADAMAFLSEQHITQPSYYVVVETPDGNFGKDIQGFYKE